ncbi:asparagine synthase C-terminal domain-containing protein [Paucibacter sp. PLA-PC-4]|uniref:asparagine synthase-related protein n=1 Tax=Paucibacter sp. PLA-PC-4 TaxID=2993655 RepID=UPI00224ABDAD|nr:asparagine synthase C-terminal domain-containing protein [Paucibacter sp. PLA-PC-4]MCX2864903.1 asparagine synthase C-terminal domain-containing protein [Paucibacter sp. PLA-PC-4]
MFRYIALAWSESQTHSAAVAQKLSLAWQHKPAWQAALVRPGLHVFATGASRGINEVWPLQDGAGVVLGKLFSRADFDSTPAPSADISSLSAARILQNQGRTLVDKFWGRYIAFVLDASNAPLVMRDPSGSLPCFKLRHQGVWIVFSWLEDVLQMLGPSEHPVVNWEVLRAQIVRGPLGGRETALAEISQVLPGEILDLHADHPTLLWSAVDVAAQPANYDLAQATQLLGHAVRSCTRAWASCYDRVLLRLSGGVDSSILLSCLAPECTLADVVCVNYHSPGADSDERDYALMTAGRVGRDLLMRERELGFRVERVMQIARMPNPVPYVGCMNTATDAKLASAYHAGAMFTGAGGDALFYELPRSWPAADYLHDKGLDAGFAGAVLDAARLGKLSVWRTLALALRERVRPKLSSRLPARPHPFLRHDCTSAAWAERRFMHPALSGGARLPIGKSVQTVALMHPIGYYDPFEQAAAPELVHPLFSQPLVELCLQLPTYVLAHGGRGRALARNAFAADLPPQVANRRSKGGMEEHITAVLHANMDFVRGLLLEGELSRRGMLDRPKVEQLLSGRPTTLPCTPSQIHGLVAVEAWLSRWTR